MKRRDFMTLLSGAAIAGPLAARAQQPALPEIGILNSLSFGPILDRLDAIVEGLEDTRYVDGKNMTLVFRSAEGQARLLPALAADLVRRDAKVIICLTSVATVRAAMAATSTIPIVFAITGDPRELGLVANIDRPEANVTGAVRLTEELNPERLKVLCELAPQPRPVAFLMNSSAAPNAVINERIRQMEAAAYTLGRQLVMIDLAGQPDIGAIFASMADKNVSAFIITTDALFNVWRDQVIGLSAGYRIAAMFPNREYTQAGGLISYGADLLEHYRVAGTYAGRILKGATPADLPVALPTKFEMVINLKTAKALGLDVPPAMRQRADEVIE
jgi:putative tryptophan/tyrosine transport system substrate-binding protein